MSTSASKARTDVRRQCKRYTWRKALSAAEGVQPTTNVARTPSEKNIVTTSNLAASIDNKRNQQATCKANSKTPCTHGPKRPSTNVATRASHRHNKPCSKHTQHMESSGQVQSRPTNIATRASHRRNKQRSNHTQHTESTGHMQSKLKNTTHTRPKRRSTNVATRASHRHKQCSKHTQHTESSGQVQSRSTNIATRASHRRNKQRGNHTQHTESSGQVQSKLTHNRPKTTIDKCSNQGLTSSQQATQQAYPTHGIIRPSAKQAQKLHAQPAQNDDRPM